MRKMMILGLVASLLAALAGHANAELVTVTVTADKTELAPGEETPFRIWAEVTNNNFGGMDFGLQAIDLNLRLSEAGVVTIKQGWVRFPEPGHWSGKPDVTLNPEFTWPSHKPDGYTGNGGFENAAVSNPAENSWDNWEADYPYLGSAGNPVWILEATLVAGPAPGTVQLTPEVRNNNVLVYFGSDAAISQHAPLEGWVGVPLEVNVIPEPGSLLLLIAAAGAGLAFARRRRR